MKLALIVSFLVMSLALNAQTIQGKVFRVADGDTITILDATNRQNKVRLNKIDALYGRYWQDGRIWPASPSKSCAIGNDTANSIVT